MSKRSKRSKSVDTTTVDTPFADAIQADVDAINAAITTDTNPEGYSTQDAADFAAMRTFAAEATAAEATAAEGTASRLPLWLATLIPAFAGILGLSRSYAVSIFARSPDRVGYGRGNSIIVAPLGAFVSVPAIGDTMTLCATDTDVPGHTLHLCGPCSVGYTYQVPGFGRWTVRTSQMVQPIAGGTYPPAMLLCSVPLMGGTRAVRETPLVSSVPMVSPRGLTLAVEVQAAPAIEPATE